MSRLVLVLGGLLALAVIAWMTARFQERRAPADPIQRMAAEEAFATGVSIGRTGRHLAALPYFRRTVEVAPDSWTAHQNYANTLYNGAQESRLHLGKDEPATRSSLERMIMIGESLRQTDEAMNWTSAPTEQALVVFQRAQAFHTFGFALDALVEFRKAASLNPGNTTIVETASRSEVLLGLGGGD